MSALEGGPILFAGLSLNTVSVSSGLISDATSLCPLLVYLRHVLAGRPAASPCSRRLQRVQRVGASALRRAARRGELPPFPRCDEMCAEEVQAFWRFPVF